VAVRTLFEAPTVAELAAAIEQADGVQNAPAEQPIPRIDRTNGDQGPADIDQLSDAEVDAMLAKADAFLVEQVAAAKVDNEGSR
jgi:hypothetical protein